MSHRHTSAAKYAATRNKAFLWIVQRPELASSSRLGLVERMQEELANGGEGRRRWGPYTRRALLAPEHNMALSQGGVLGLNAIFILKKGVLFPPLSNSFKPPPAQRKFLELYNKDTFRIAASFSERVSYVNAISEKLPSALHFNPALKTCKIETEKDTLKIHWVSSVFHFYLRLLQKRKSLYSSS